VNSVREHLPPLVDFVVGRVSDIEAGPQRQTVILSNGATIDARLVVLASGYSDALRQKVGIERKVIRNAHSLSLGFSIVPAGRNGFDFPGLTYYGDRLAERIGYVSFFPIGEVMRANLFCYRGHDGAWGKAFRERPRETLFATMPGLKPHLGDIEIVGQVKLRVADLYVVEGHRRDGVVLIGDATQTTCPAAGNGVTRVLTDVTRLCTVHVPRWLATPGMAAEKINAFYDDPIKRACDEHCLWTAEYARSFATDPGLIWRARRVRAFVRPGVRRIVGALRTGRAPSERPTGSAAREGRAETTPAATNGRDYRSSRSASGG
jgi:2-polyprenyl-6-methoxyphenol hydroxylase-like FAD-dependent oxidoreductase